ncbi:response regulator [Lentzea sp. NEAU-D7]|uniref:response regulator n=1 Tax=Lentzea sp. NEAU-D7 TaxID=2994667 RepID=UPI00224B744D|nr:response regulator [Lentzea sp. NEAU-D7]MCX2952556.1 response regulator [Lentzea sp. NEAU-D7]
MSLAGLVLVVEDEDPVRRYTVSLLEELGFTVLQAIDGIEAIAVLRERSAEIGVMLLDHSMPGLSGEEVLAELKREGLTVPVVLTSGYDRTSLERRFSAHEIAGYLQKPFRLETLDETIRAVLADRAQAS